MKAFFKRFLTLKPETGVIFLLCIFAFLIRVYFLLTSDNFYGALPMSVVLGAMRLLTGHGVKFFGLGARLQLYENLIGCVLWFWNQPLIVSRVVSLVFGSFFVVPYYYFTKLVTNKKTAFVSSFFLCLYPLHIILSVLSREDVTYCFFLFCAFVFFFKFKKYSGRKILFLIFSAVFLNLSCLMRYDGWIFIPILAVFLLPGKKYIFFLSHF